jgi:hypothetical protein
MVESTLGIHLREFRQDDSPDNILVWGINVLLNAAFVTRDECQRNNGLYLTFRAMENTKDVDMHQQSLQPLPHLSAVWVTKGTIEAGPAC